MTDGSLSARSDDEQASSRVARQREQETRRALAALKLPRERLLFLGLYDGTVPHAGRFFQAVVDAIVFLMWLRDCNVICAPCFAPPELPDHQAANMVAKAVAEASDVRMIGYPVTARSAENTASTKPYGRSPSLVRRDLDIGAHLIAKAKAVTAHGGSFEIGSDENRFETYFQ